MTGRLSSSLALVLLSSLLQLLTQQPASTAAASAAVGGAWRRDAWMPTMDHPEIPDELKDAKHGVKMGVTNAACDDAKSRLDMDWDGNPVNHTCFTPKQPIAVRDDVPSTLFCAAQTDPPTHICTTSHIVYNDSLPTSGAHRPLWPRFGEYTFVPLQRWIHNLEVGCWITKKSRETNQNICLCHRSTALLSCCMIRALILMSWIA